MAERTTTLQQESKTDFLSRPVLAAYNVDWEKVTYGAFILIALVTRLAGLGSRVMSHDESLHTQFSLQFYNGDGYAHTPLMHGPFLFHITTVFYWLFGPSDFSARLPVALFGVALVGMPYFLRRWLGKTGALFTSFLFLISPFVLYYSRYIRHDIYIIVWALILFIASWNYLSQRKEKYLWWFAGGLALMFATKEVAFIYVAIFGSFLVIRLLVQLWQTEWFRSSFSRLRAPIFVLLIALVLFGAGAGGLRVATGDGAEEGPATAEEGQFAADPNQATESAAATGGGSLLHWLQVLGALGAGAAVFMGARELRPELEEYAEFDLIILYSTLLLPAVSPLLVTLAGFNATDYTINLCELAGQETMTSLELFLARLLNGTCLSAFLSSAVVRTGFFVVLTLAVAIYVGLWWKRRRWLIAAAIFHGIFFILYTSVFTNPAGWGTGMVGSLGYWLEQQAVQRGNQPWFYYLMLVPLYEFFPLIISTLAIRLWARKHRLNKIVSYWLPLLFLTLLAYSFTDWFANRPTFTGGDEPSNLIAIIVAAVLLFAGVLYWFLARSQQIRDSYDLGRSWRGLLEPNVFIGFVPGLIWWLLLTWVAYTAAGEKMPWLSTHFVIPMALLSGWYLNERLTTISVRELLSRRMAALAGVAAILIVVVALAVGPLLLGTVRFGDQGLASLRGIGRVLGGIALAVALFYLLHRVGQPLGRRLQRRAWMLGGLLVLSLLTIRVAYTASFPNADYPTEFLVYAHAGPGVKNPIMSQIDELSMRLYGDKSMKVAWSDDGTWPMQWYLREYPNRQFTGKTPNAGIAEFPAVVVGRGDWTAYEQFLDEDEYDVHTYTFLWWPTEDYRQISWNAVFGRKEQTVTEQTAAEFGVTVEPDEQKVIEVGTGRGLAAPGVRQALWDIIFYRDYTKYNEVFGKSLTLGNWNPRADMRLYIRRDVLATLWDYGVAGVGIEPPVDPYAEGELTLLPELVIDGEGGSGDGQLRTPRNVAIGPEGNIYVLDTGNHRVQVFDQNGEFVRGWGGQGSNPGQFNEPWGIAVDDAFVYVTDTWNYRVQKFTLAGDFVTSFGEGGNVIEMGQESGGFFFGPRSIVLLPDNQLLVTDTGNHRLQLFDRDGNFLRAIGQQGVQPGQFNEPVGMALGPDGSLFLADTWNARVQRFSPALVPSLQWDVDAWEGDSTNNKPYLAVDPAGRVFVTDPENFRVLIFSSEGQYLGRFGRAGQGTDSLGLPNGIATDADGNVYIADAGNNRILKFAPPELSGAPAPAGDENAPANNGNGAETEPTETVEE